MAYCSVGDLSGRLSDEKLIQLTDDGNTGSANQDRAAAAIADAQELIDGYLRGRMTLPLNPVPGLIKNIAVTLAAYSLFQRRLNVMPAPEQMKNDYDGAIRTLEKIQSGKITINDADAARGPGSYKVNKTRRDRMFGKQRLEEF
ncbi:MAG: DUF1320 domain-containing protein [Elusimicrobiales bacterium]